MREPHPILRTLAERRKALSMSQEGVGVAIGIHRKAVNRMELGHADPRLRDVAAYAQAVGTRLNLGLPTDAASLLREAAKGRREYAESLARDKAMVRVVELLELQAHTLDAAAQVVDGQLGPLYDWLPSWRWTDEMSEALHRGEEARDG